MRCMYFSPVGCFCFIYGMFCHAITFFTFYVVEFFLMPLWLIEHFDYFFKITNVFFFNLWVFSFTWFTWNFFWDVEVCFSFQCVPSCLIIYWIIYLFFHRFYAVPSLLYIKFSSILASISELYPLLLICMSIYMLVSHFLFSSLINPDS